MDWKNISNGSMLMLQENLNLTHVNRMHCGSISPSCRVNAVLEIYSFSVSQKYNLTPILFRGGTGSNNTLVLRMIVLHTYPKNPYTLRNHP